MSIRIIDSSTARQLPWKNGKGVTVELAISPQGADLDNFDWRISSARVASAGAFSRFPGINRSLGLLSGAGLRLHLPEQVNLELDRRNPVVAFPGELDVQAELLAGPVQDFNLMSRRSHWQQHLQYLELQGQHWLDSSTVMLIYCCAGEGLNCVSPDNAPISLSAGQGLLVQDSVTPWQLTSQGSSKLFLARLEPVRNNQKAIDPAN